MEISLEDRLKARGQPLYARRSKRINPNMVNDPSRKDPKAADTTELLFWMAEQKLSRFGFIPYEELPGLLLAAIDRVPPRWLLEHVAAHLRGEVKPGRRRLPDDNEWRNRFVPLARRDYDRLLPYLQRRAKRRALLARRKSSRLDGPPHEVALSLVLQHYRKTVGEFRNIDERRFRNLLSSPL
jgi:hypothetical protein